MSGLHGFRVLADIYTNIGSRHHFREVVQFDEFLNLTSEQVVNLIKSDRLSVPSEEKVCMNSTRTVMLSRKKGEQNCVVISRLPEKGEENQPSNH